MSNASKLVAAVVGLVITAIVFSRQLFLFTVFKDPQGLLEPPGATHHLWLSFIAGVVACIAGALIFYFFARQERDEGSQPQNAQLESPIEVHLDHSASNAPTPTTFGTTHWAQLNPWLSEGQEDDRRPVDGSVAGGRGTPSGQRTLARESHQRKFKKWSQARRE